MAALAPAFDSYPGLRETLFVAERPGYLRFADGIAAKEDLKKLVDESPAVAATRAQYTAQLAQWWQSVVARFEALPQTKNIFELYGAFATSFSEAIATLKGGQQPVLDAYQGRGTLAAYWSSLQFDLRSVAASGWNAELIPDEELLESQFPEVLAEQRQNEARRDELEALFKEVAELEEDSWSEDDYELWPPAQLKAHREELKALKGEWKEKDRAYKNLQKRIKANSKDARNNPALQAEVARLQSEAFALEMELDDLGREVESGEGRMARHCALEDELKVCKKVIRDIRERKENLVAIARNRITPEAAKDLILDRWNRLLHQTLEGYLQTHSRNLLQAVENLWDKFTTPLHRILAEREAETTLLNQFLMELGYE